MGSDALDNLHHVLTSSNCCYSPKTHINAPSRPGSTHPMSMPVQSENSKRLYFRWSIERRMEPDVRIAWWDGVQRLPGDLHLRPDLPRDVNRCLSIFVACRRKWMPDFLPIRAGGYTGNVAVLSQRVIDDLNEAGIEVPHRACEYVGIDDPEHQRPIRDPSLANLPPYYYLAPPVGEFTASGDPNRPYYTGDAEIFTLPNKRGGCCDVFCTFKVKELALRKMWTNVTMGMVSREKDLSDFYLKNKIMPCGTLADLKKGGDRWPPLEVRDMLARGYRL